MYADGTIAVSVPRFYSMTMKMKNTILCTLAIAMTACAATLPGFDGVDLGTVTSAWKFSYADSEEGDNLWCVLALAGKALPGAVMPIATGDPYTRQVDVQTQNAEWTYRRAQSFVFAEDALMGAGYTWTLRVIANDDKGEPRTDKQSVLLAPLSGYAAGIPDGALFTLKDSAGSVVQDAIDPRVSNTLSLKPGNYTLLVAVQVKEVSFDVEIAPGWNLVGIPLAKVTDAAKLFAECTLFDPADGNSRVTEAAKLTAGAAYWVHSKAADMKKYTIKGLASTNQASHLPQMARDWNFACPIARYVEAQGKLELCQVPTDGKAWDNAGGCFTDESSGNALLGKGYVLPEGI